MAKEKGSRGLPRVAGYAFSLLAAGYLSSALLYWMVHDRQPLAF